jgi:hypothetical protein
MAAIHPDAGALPRQRLRDGAPQPLGTPAHQGDAASETEIHAGAI